MVSIPDGSQQRAICETPSVLGIALDVHEPRRYARYLAEALRRCGARSLLKALADHPLFANSGGATTAPLGRYIGYHGETLLAIIDREWRNGPTNEFRELASYCDTVKLFGSDSRGVFIWGAGACRLGDYLLSLGCDRVACADLSWLALYFGRSLIMGRSDALPEPLLRQRRTYSVASDSRDITGQWEEARFERPWSQTGRDAIEFVVRDIFYACKLFEYDTVVLPFILDCCLGQQMLTMLCRASESVRKDQKLIVVMTCVSSPYDAGRDPKITISMLQRLGFELEFVDLVRLKYSFSYADFGLTTSEANTLVVRAFKRRDGAPAAKIVRTKLAASTASAVVSDKMWLSAEATVLLREIGNGVSYVSLIAEASHRISNDRFQVAMGELASAGLIDMVVADVF